MAKVITLTHERLLERLDYDPVTGIFLWKVRPSNRTKIGDCAGLISGNGHRYISIDGDKFQGSRLAWFYVHKEWPKGDIKQRDGDHDNCSIENLRDVSRIDSARERGIVSSNSTGFKGVSPAPFGRFQASITWNYKQISLGSNFDTAAEASAVYKTAEDLLTKAQSDHDRALVVVSLKLQRRQRAAWTNLVAQNIPLGWPSFEAFAIDVIDVPARRYAMGPLNAAQPIGPSNYHWSSEFGHNTGTAEGRRAYSRSNRATNKDQHRDRDFRKKYGINFAEYQRLLIEQKGVCAICEQPEIKIQNGSIQMLSVDHNHKSGAVRGLLCSNCNLAIGYACDSPDVLVKAISYLRHHSGDSNNVVPFEPAIVDGVMGNGA